MFQILWFSKFHEQFHSETSSVSEIVQLMLLIQIIEGRNKAQVHTDG